MCCITRRVHRITSELNFSIDITSLLDTLEIISLNVSMLLEKCIAVVILEDLG